MYEGYIVSLSAEDYVRRMTEITALDEEGEHERAVLEAQATAGAARAAGDEGYAHFFTGEALALSGDLTGSAEQFRIALKLLPQVSFFHSNYAVLLSLNDKVHPALQHLAVALNLDEDNVQAWAQKSICLAKLNRHAEALDCFDQVLTRQPDNLHALRNKAISLARLGRDGVALELFDQVIARDPADQHARTEREILQEEMSLRGTPLGWLFLWLRRRVFPVFSSYKYQR